MMARRTSGGRAVSITAMTAMALTLVLGTATSATAEENAILVPGGTAFKQINPFYPFLAATYPDIGTNFHTDTDAQLIDYSQNILNSYAAVAEGVAATAEAVDATEGPVVVIGESLGGVVASQLAMRLAESPDSPPPDQIRFVLMATPEVGVGRYFPEGTCIPILNAIVSRVPETVYDTIVVVGEYDGWADPPDRPWNLIASANALLGTNTVHGPPMFVADPATVPPENITVATNSAGGTVTTYLVPTENPPLTQWLRNIGMPDWLGDQIDEVLRPIIDSAYLRHDEPGDRRPYLSNGKIHFPNGKIHANSQGRQAIPEGEGQQAGLGMEGQQAGLGMEGQAVGVEDEQGDFDGQGRQEILDGEGQRAGLGVEGQQAGLGMEGQAVGVEDEQGDFDGQGRQEILDGEGQRAELGMEGQAPVVEDEQGDFDGQGRHDHGNVQSPQETGQSAQDEERGEEGQERGAEHGQESLTEPQEGGAERQDGGTERQNRQGDQR